MKKLVIILCFSSVIFSSCYANNAAQHNVKVQTKVLEEIDLTDKIPTSQGSELTLLKISNKCRLIYNVYGETGQEEYNFDFKKSKIIKATYFSYNYKANKDGIIDLANLSDKDFILVKKGNASPSKFIELKNYLNKNILLKNCN